MGTKSFIINFNNGDSYVGKISILLQYTANFFQETHITPIGVHFKLK